jgi:hypothetical protein
LKVKGVTTVTSFATSSRPEGEEDAPLQIRPAVRPEIGPELVSVATRPGRSGTAASAGVAWALGGMRERSVEGEFRI